MIWGFSHIFGSTHLVTPMLLQVNQIYVESSLQKHHVSTCVVYVPIGHVYLLDSQRYFRPMECFGMVEETSSNHRSGLLSNTLF